MPETWSLENLAHLPEIINDAINGIVAFILYWPFIWLLFSLGGGYEPPCVLAVFGDSYEKLLGLGAAWIGILIAVPFIGLLNRAINHTFIDTVQKYINSFRFPLICKIPEFVRMITMKTIKKQFNLLIKDNELSNIDESLYPCWRLQGSFDFVNYRHWLIDNPNRKSYWDWEHFLDWVYKMYYQTFLLFLIIYSVLLPIIYLLSNIQFHLVDLLVFILILPTYALYREYLLHHIAWIRMDQKFYVEYLIGKKGGVSYHTKGKLKKGLEKENYERVERTLRRHFFRNYREHWDIPPKVYKRI